MRTQNKRITATTQTKHKVTKKRKRKRSYIALKKELRENRDIPSFPYMRVGLVFEQPVEVTSIRYFDMAKTSYAVCPACGYAMEREYQQHCEVCGQLLAWNLYAQNAVDVIRIGLPPDYDPSENDPLKGLIHNISADVAKMSNRKPGKVDLLRLRIPWFVEVRKKSKQ